MAADLAQFNVAFPWFFPMAVAVFGACVGSFLNVVILRVPREESVVTPGSRCGCGEPIRWHDNIPVLSWLLLRGRARCCGRPFSFRYAFVELLTAGLFTACWLRLSPWAAVAGWVLLGCLIAATFIDLDHFIIPDVFTLGLAVAGLLLSMLIPALHGHGAAPAPLGHLRSAADSLQGLLIGSTVLDTRGRPASVGRLMVRNVARVLELPLFGLGLWLAFVLPSKRALHDLLSGTVVGRPE